MLFIVINLLFINHKQPFTLLLLASILPVNSFICLNILLRKPYRLSVYLTYYTLELSISVKLHLNHMLALYSLYLITYRPPSKLNDKFRIYQKVHCHISPL